MEISTRSTRIGEIVSIVFEDETEFQKDIKILQMVQENLKTIDVEGYVAMKHVVSALQNSYSQDERFHNGRPSTMFPLKDAEDFASAFFAFVSFAGAAQTEMTRAQQELDSQDEKIAALKKQVDQAATSLAELDALRQYKADAEPKLEKFSSPAVQAVMNTEDSPFRTANN